MQQLIEQILDYLRGMWQRRWIGLAVAWMVGHRRCDLRVPPAGPVRSVGARLRRHAVDAAAADAGMTVSRTSISRSRS